MELSEQILPKPEITEVEDIGTGLESRVILFNDEWHTFEEVIVQIIKATNCSFENARKKTFEVHVKGKAIIFSGKLTDCIKVSSVLEEIALHTQVVT